MNIADEVIIMIQNIEYHGIVTNQEIVGNITHNAIAVTACIQSNREEIETKITDLSIKDLMIHVYIKSE